MHFQMDWKVYIPHKPKHLCIFPIEIEKLLPYIDHLNYLNSLNNFRSTKNTADFLNLIEYNKVVIGNGRPSPPFPSLGF